MSDDRDDQPDYRQPEQPVTTRGAMPDWAKAKATSQPDPDVREMFKRLKLKLFGSQDDAV